MAGSDRKVVIPQHRDVHLLRELGVMRVIDRELAKLVAGFGSTTRANARLLALTQAGFLHRHFWGTVGGARKSLYSLSPLGAALAGVPYRRPRRGQDQILASDSLSAHQLEVNAVYCTLKYRPLPLDTKFIRWVAFQEPVYGKLIPDGYAEVGATGKTLTLFLEVDRGTEGREVWRAKVQAYLAYATSGNFSQQFGQVQFRTLVVTNSESRLTALRIATAALTEKIFRFTTTERIKGETFWGTIWQKPTGNERQALSEVGHSSPPHCPPQCPQPGEANPLGMPLSIREVAKLIGISTWTIRQKYLPLGHSPLSRGSDRQAALLQNAGDPLAHAPAERRNVSLYKRGGVWWSYLYQDGVRHQFSTGTGNRKDAQKIEDKRKQELNDSPVSDRRVRSGHDLRRDRRAVHRERIGPAHHHLPPAVPAADSFRRRPRCESRSHWPKNSGKSGKQFNPEIKDATINRDLSVLRHILYWAVDEQLLAANPLARTQDAAERRTRRQILSVAEEASLLGVAKDHLRAMIMIALDTGMRRGEITSQRWEDIDFSQKIIS